MSFITFAAIGPTLDLDILDFLKLSYNFVILENYLNIFTFSLNSFLHSQVIFSTTICPSPLNISQCSTLLLTTALAGELVNNTYCWLKEPTPLNPLNTCLWVLKTSKSWSKWIGLPITNIWDGNPTEIGSTFKGKEPTTMTDSKQILGKEERRGRSILPEGISSIEKKYQVPQESSERLLLEQKGMS